MGKAMRSITTKYLLIFVLLLVAVPSVVHARPEYAERVGKGCTLCHSDNNGGPLNTVGFAYIRNGYRYPIPERLLEEGESLQTGGERLVNLIFGYLHLIAAALLIGAIFYIHIFVGASQLTSGIPRNERILGMTCLITLIITGIYLTGTRLESVSGFFESTFGILLFIKILLFTLMLLSAIAAITVIHRRMRKEYRESVEGESESGVSAGNLSSFDGSSGKPAYIVFESKIYDVSKSKKWKEGRHFGKHSAGTDLTDALKGAPHGSEVLERVKYIGDLVGEKSSTMSTVRKIFITLAYGNLVIISLIFLCVALWRWGFPLYSLESNDPVAGSTCLDCHRTLNPGIVNDWERSVHSMVGTDCMDCHHATGLPEKLISKAHLKQHRVPISIVVSSKRCAGCHAKEFNEYARSKHANTLAIIWKIDKWLQHGMNNSTERSTGCFTCHGSEVVVREGRPLAGTWPNVGVGRKNPDGSLGSCSSCHTRHRFSVVEARKPEACDQCHLGPDHPQIEIYRESKHGTIYAAEGDSWNWSPDDRKWKAGRDYRAPTCSSCHMSEAVKVPKTHDVTERLSWETQAPLTVRPADFKPFPAKTDWQKERGKMKRVCQQCHADGWTNAHFTNLDEVVQNYNENYYKPVAKVMSDLYRRGLLSDSHYFDEKLEWEFYELWHHEGRRARMGAAMMAPDYAWWHGFYELKNRYVQFMRESELLKSRGSGHRFTDFPGMFKR